MTPEIPIRENHESQTNFRLEIVSGRQELAGLARNMFAGKESRVHGLLFAGDRISCCDEATVLKRGNQVIGMATIAPEGEEHSGTPTIVGLYIQPEFRQKGYGTLLLTKAIIRGLERGFPRIRMDVMSERVIKIIEKLPAELKEKLKINDMGNIFDLFTSLYR